MDTLSSICTSDLTNVRSEKDVDRPETTLSNNKLDSVIKFKYFNRNGGFLKSPKFLEKIKLKLRLRKLKKASTKERLFKIIQYLERDSLNKKIPEFMHGHNRKEGKSKLYKEVEELAAKYYGIYIGPSANWTKGNLKTVKFYIEKYVKEDAEEYQKWYRKSEFIKTLYRLKIKISNKWRKLWNT